MIFNTSLKQSVNHQGARRTNLLNESPNCPESRGGELIPTAGWSNPFTQCNHRTWTSLPWNSCPQREVPARNDFRTRPLPWLLVHGWHRSPPVGHAAAKFCTQKIMALLPDRPRCESLEGVTVFLLLNWSVSWEILIRKVAAVVSTACERKIKVGKYIYFFAPWLCPDNLD